MDYIYELEFDVRDNECDVYGVVNNSQYQNYMSHARNKFLCEKGVNLVELFNNGIVPMVRRTEIDYMSPLFPFDEFVVKIAVEKKKSTRLLFYQDIFKKDGTQCIRAQVTTIAIDKEEGMPLMLDEVFSELYHKHESLFYKKPV